jgi:hypothetical protein
MLTTKVDPRADAIQEKLFPIHRGVIRVADGFVLFGNDGYTAPGVQGVVSELLRRLRDEVPYPAQELIVSADGYTWAVILAPDYAEGDRLVEEGRAELMDLLWEVWASTPNEGRTAPEAGGWQRATAEAELAVIGGGFADVGMQQLLRGRGGLVRDNLVVNQLMLSMAALGEDCHLVLGGIPYSAKLTADRVRVVGIEREAVVMVIATEDVGDPRSESTGTATAFVPKGALIPAVDSGERHPTTGLRCFVPTDPTTGAPLPD